MMILAKKDPLKIASNAMARRVTKTFRDYSIECRVDDDHEHARASKLKIMVEFKCMVT